MSHLLIFFALGVLILLVIFAYFHIAKAHARIGAIEADVRADVTKIDGDVVSALHGAEKDGKVAEGTVQQYVDTALADAKKAI